MLCGCVVEGKEGGEVGLQRVLQVGVVCCCSYFVAFSA